jgi:transcriptional regulator with XRE-family HTH domain
MTFSEKLLIVRKNAGHTQNKMAKLVGISRASLNYYENNTREPGIGFLRNVCEVYGVSPAWMLGLEEGRDDVVVLVPGTDEAMEAIKRIKAAVTECKKAISALEVTCNKEDK